MAEEERFEHGSILGGKTPAAGSALSGNQHLIIVGHNLLDGVRAADLGAFGPWWRLLHEPGSLPLDVRGGVLYPALPWIGERCRNAKTFATNFCTRKGRRAVLSSASRLKSQILDSCRRTMKTPFQAQAVTQIEGKQCDVRRTGKQFERLHRIKRCVEFACARLRGKK